MGASAYPRGVLAALPRPALSARGQCTQCLTAERSAAELRGRLVLLSGRLVAQPSGTLPSEQFVRRLPRSLLCAHMVPWNGHELLRSPPWPLPCPPHGGFPGHHILWCSADRVPLVCHVRAHLCHGHAHSQHSW